MNTLTIPQIFSQLSFYQDHYLEIIQDSAQYFTPVAGAEIRLWPLATKQLYLGDLLQLWFAEKWLVEKERQYIYELAGNLLTGSNQSKVWQASAKETQVLSVANVSKHYFEYRALTQPKLVKAPQGKWGVL